MTVSPGMSDFREVAEFRSSAQLDVTLNLPYIALSMIGYSTLRYGHWNNYLINMRKSQVRAVRKPIGNGSFSLLVSASNLPQFRAFRTFRTLNQKERSAEKKFLQNNPNRASERNAENCLQSLTEPHLRKPLNYKRHAQCTLSFC